MKHMLMECVKLAAAGFAIAVVNMIVGPPEGFTEANRISSAMLLYLVVNQFTKGADE